MCVQFSNARSLCSEARGSTFSNTPIYFMTSPQTRFSFSHGRLGGFQLGTEQRGSREITPQQDLNTPCFPCTKRGRQEHFHTYATAQTPLLPDDSCWFNWALSLTTGRERAPVLFSTWRRCSCTCARKSSATFLQVGTCFSDTKHVDAKYFRTYWQSGW